VLYNKSKKAALALQGKIKQLQDWINNGIKNIQAKAQANLAKGNALKQEIKTFFNPKAAAAAPAKAAPAAPAKAAPAKAAPAAAPAKPAAAAPAPAKKLRRLVMSVDKGISELESFFESPSNKRRMHFKKRHLKKHKRALRRKRILRKKRLQLKKLRNLQKADSKKKD